MSNVARACGAVALLTLVAYAVTRVVSVLWQPGSWSGPILVGLALTSGLFLAAGVMRLAMWRLCHDPRNALVGSALLVMGGLCLPLGGFARLFSSPELAPLISTSIRCVSAYVAMHLVLRALRITEVTDRDRPDHLLPRLALLVVAVFLAMLVLERLAPSPAALLGPGHVVPAALSVALSVALAAGWFWVSYRVATSGHSRRWAGRAAPLFCGMGLHEALRGLDLGHLGSATLAGVLIATVMAALACRSALLDLDHAIRTDEHHQRDLSSALQQAHGQTDELTVWREQLTHDARNACAGLRAAITILDRYGDQVDPATAHDVRQAAAHEIGHLEHLLAWSADAAPTEFAVLEVLQRVAGGAAVLGTRVRVTGERVRATGRPGDLEAALKNLLANARAHAPGSLVQLSVEQVGDQVRITCSDDGPGVPADVRPHAFERGVRGQASPGSGLGLYAARQLLLEQGGDLVLGRPGQARSGPGHSGQGTVLVLTLPSVDPLVAGVSTLRVPAQRTRSVVVKELTA